MFIHFVIMLIMNIILTKNNLLREVSLSQSKFPLNLFPPPSSVQPDPAMRAHHRHRPHELLHAKRLRREGHAGHHDAAVHDCVPHGDWRIHATHVGEAAADWWVLGLVLRAC